MENVGSVQNKMKRLKIILLFLISFFVLSGCGIINRNDSIKKTIVTTLYPEYDFIREIIGNDKRLNDYFNVSLVLPPGADSHTFDPRLSDLINIKNANLFIYTSDEVETWVSKLDISSYTEVLDLSSDERIELIATNEHDHDHDHHHEGHNHEYDPHYWIYPIYASYMVDSIRNKMLEIAPDLASEAKDLINKNADNYIQKLIILDKMIKKVIDAGTCKKLFFASPFSFYYWSYFYDLEYVLTYSTCSTEVEPSLDTIIDVIEEIKQNDVKVIYTKELLNDDVALMISQKTNAKVLLLHSCHNVSKADFKENRSFLSIMYDNLKNLAAGVNAPSDTAERIIEEGENEYATNRI